MRDGGRLFPDIIKGTERTVWKDYQITIEAFQQNGSEYCIGCDREIRYEDELFYEVSKSGSDIRYTRCSDCAAALIKSRIPKVCGWFNNA